MPFGLSPVHLLAALAVALVILGPRRLPKLGSSAGRWLRDMREGVVETKDSFISEVAKPAPSETHPAPISPVAGERTD